MMLVVKVHHRDGRTIVAVAEKALLGKIMAEGGKQLDLRGEFYNGEPISDVNGVGDLLRNADAVNLVGKEAVELGLEEDVIDEENVKSIGGIPYAQAVLIHD